MHLYTFIFCTAAATYTNHACAYTQTNVIELLYNYYLVCSYVCIKIFVFTVVVFEKGLMINIFKIMYVQYRLYIYIILAICHIYVYIIYIYIRIYYMTDS